MKSYRKTEGVPLSGQSRFQRNWMNRDFPGNGSSRGGHCWARVGLGLPWMAIRRVFYPHKSPEKLRGIKYNELHDHSWSLTRWTSVSLPRQRSSDSYLSSWLSLIIWRCHYWNTMGFCLWRLISSCGASKYYLFSAVTKPSLGLLACGSKASLQTPGCSERKCNIGCRVPEIGGVRDS